MSRIQLGSRVDGTGRPTFRASVGQHSLTIALDSSAVLALASGPPGPDCDAVLDVRRGMIRQAAQRLYDQGFWSKTDHGLEILVSSLDFGTDAN